MASLAVIFYVLYVTVVKGMQMLGLEDPYISSLEEVFNYEEAGKI